MHNRTEQEIMKNWNKDLYQPIVSVCCITYNHEKYISEALDGFLMQETDFPFEVIVRDDASLDKTADIIKEYEKKFPNIIKPIYEKENGYSKGIKPSPITFKKALGEYIALCEGDDYWTDPKKLQIQIYEMKKSNIGLSFHLNSKLYGSGECEPPIYLQGSKIYTTLDIIEADFHLIQTNTIVFKKEYLKNLDYSLLKESPVGDIWIRIATSIPDGALFINRDMATYRILSQGSWSSSMDDDSRFITFVTKMIRSIDTFDKYWDLKYSRKFKVLKNMFITTVIKRDISDSLKYDFVDNHKNLMSYKNFILWHLLYKYPLLLRYLKHLKKTIKG